MGSYFIFEIVKFNKTPMKSPRLTYCKVKEHHSPDIDLSRFDNTGHGRSEGWLRRMLTELFPNEGIFINIL